MHKVGEVAGAVRGKVEYLQKKQLEIFKKGLHFLLISCIMGVRGTCFARNAPELRLWTKNERKALMKKLLLLVLASAIMLSLCILPASAEVVELTEEWDDYENPNVKFYDYNDTEHDCSLCGTGDDVVDNTGTYTWFQGGHLKNASGHFAHVGSYCVITLPKGTNFQWWTQYRGPAADGYSTHATIYIDGVEVATVGTEQLNGQNLVNAFMVWDSGELDGTKDHVIKIVNTAPMPDDFNEEEASWLGTGVRLPFDFFKVSYMGEPPAPETFGTEWVDETEEPTAAPTDAPTDAPESKPAESKPATSEKKDGCGGMIGAGALVLAAVLAAPVAISRKRR